MADKKPPPDFSNPVYSQMPTGTSWLPSYAQELNTLYTLQARRERLGITVGSVTPEQQRRLNEIARVVPYAGPSAVQLAQGLYDPDHPIVQRVAREKALMSAERQGLNLGITGTLVNPSIFQRGSPRTRLNTAIRAANAAGLLTPAGQLTEPAPGNTPERYVWEQVQDAALANVYSDAPNAPRTVPYIDHEGIPRRFSLDRNTQLGNTIASISAHQRMEAVSQGDPARILQLERFDDVARRLIPGEAQRARELGVIDERGFLHDPTGPNDRPGDQTEAEAIFNRIERMYRDQGEDFPFFHHSLGPTVIRNSEGGHWDSLFPQADQQRRSQPSGIRGVLSEASELSQTRAGTDLPVLSRLEEPWRRSVQAANMALSAPLQELQGQVRNIYASAQGENPNYLESQSDLGIAIGANLAGEEVELGQGYFVDPDSAIARERVRREATRGQINGRNMTIGRLAANTFFEPGDIGYTALSGLLDMSVALFADPVSVGGSQAARIRNIRSTFAPGVADDALRQAGGIRGVTTFVHGPTATEWLDGNQGRAVTAAIAEEASPTYIWRGMNRKVDPSFATALANTTDETQVRDMLRPLLGTTFRRTDEVWKRPYFNAIPRYSAAGSRFTRLLPGNDIDTFDLNDVVTRIERFGQSVGMPEERLVQHLDSLSRTRNRHEILSEVESVMSDTEGILAQAGVSNPDIRRRLTSLWRDTHDSSRRWFIDEIGSDVPVWGSVMNAGSDMELGMSPHLVTELLTRNIPLPDVRTLRRLTGNRLSRTLTTKHSIFRRDQMAGEQRIPITLLEGLQNEVWKPFVLGRAAWPVRVIGEEQARMAASGLHSMFRSPLSYIAWTVGRKSRFGRGDVDILGTPLEEAEEFTAAMSRIRGGFLDDEPYRVRTHQWGVATKNQRGAEDLFLDGWATELHQLWADPVARQLVSSNNMDEALEWFQRGAGQRFRDDLVASSPAGATLRQDAVARRYLESVAERIRVKTGGDNDLIDLVRTGRLNDNPIFDIDGLRHAREFKPALKNYMDSAPDAVKFEITAAQGGPYQTALENTVDALHRGTDWAFGWLMGRPTNYLSRSPAFRQYYWQNMERMAGFADDIDALTASAREAGFSNRQIREWVYRSGRAAPDERMGIEELDTLAKAHALEDTKKLLYDLSERSQAADAMRLIAPFGAAWQEFFTTWGRILKSNPTTAPRRLSQAVEAGKDSGFFFEDENGQLIFTYPGSEFLTRSLLDVPIPLSGTAEGLSFMTQIMPGVGPAIQVPVAWLTAGKPELQWIRNQLIPFGAPGAEGEDAPELGSLSNIMQLAPPWMQRFVQFVDAGGFDPESDRLYSNTVNRVAQYLSSTGRYNLEDPAQFQEMMEHARSRARWFYLIRAGASFVAPSAPSPRWIMETSQGNMAIAQLTQEYRRLRDENFETADEEFLSRFGDDVVLAMTPLSRTLAWGVTPSLEFYNWQQQNLDLKDRYPTVYAMFGPQDDGSDEDFEYGVYAAEFQNGTRESLSSQEWMRLSQHLIATRLMNKARREAGNDPTESDRQWLRDTEAWLRETYPGYQNLLGIPEGPNTESALVELQGIIEHPSIRDSDIAEDVRYYLSERDWAIASADGGTLRGENDAHLRGYLRDLGISMSGESPQFARIYDYILSRELDVEEDEEAQSRPVVSQLSDSGGSS